MNNLNKENLFDEMTIRYPIAMKKFGEWIDQYKKDNNWNLLFNSDSDYQNRHGKNAPAPKFHDLPYELQIGIILKFGSTIFNEPGSFIHMEEMKELFESCFKAIEYPNENA